MNNIHQNTIPASCPNLIGIVPFFELQSLKKSEHSDFLRREKKTFSLGKKVSISDIFVVILYSYDMLACSP